MSTWPRLRRVRQAPVPDAVPAPAPRPPDPGGARSGDGGEDDRGVDAVVLVVSDGSRGLAPRVRGQLEGALPHLRVEGVDAPPAGAELDGLLRDTGVPVLLVVTSEVEGVGAALVHGSLDPRLGDLGWILVTDAEEHRDLAPAIPSTRFHCVLSLGHGPRVLIDEVAEAVTACLRARGIDEGDLGTLLGSHLEESGGAPVIAGLDQEDARCVEVLLRGVHEVLGPCPRIHLPAGTVLTRQDAPVGAVHLLLSGGVALRRDAERATVLLHRATTGPIIGLVSLVRGQRAHFTATTTVPTVVVRLSRDQLARVVREDSQSAEALTVLTIHSLTRRLVRAEELHVEKGVLAADLEADRAELAQALEDLRSTRAELVERTRFAMLGELSAGVAHELNNPLSAMTRSAAHLRRDVVKVLGLGGMDTAVRALRRTRETPPRSTAEERALLKELLAATDGDRAAARRMLRLGVSDVGTARVLLASPDDALKEAELGARIGSSLRSITAASQRVTGLAKSLRSYARPEGEEPGPVDVHASLDDALRLTAHRLHGIRVETVFTDVPPVLARSGSLEQVWMNLLVNAADAFEDEREDLASSGEARDGEERALPARGSAAPRILVEVTR